MKKHLILFIVLGFLIASPAYASLFGFYNITNNKAADAAIGEAQLSVYVVQSDDDVIFAFRNIGPEASSITQVYFDDDSSLLDEILSLDEGPGVSFHVGANPPNLPGGNTVGFTSDFSIGPDAPVQPNGVNPNEYLDVLFSLETGALFSQVIADMESGALRIGIHVQGYTSEGSESFVTHNTNSIPEPATMLLLGSGLIGFAVVGRKKFFSK
jgi:hypothetical protein